MTDSGDSKDYMISKSLVINQQTGQALMLLVLFVLIVRRHPNGGGTGA